MWTHIILFGRQIRFGLHDHFSWSAQTFNGHKDLTANYTHIMKYMLTVAVGKNSGLCRILVIQIEQYQNLAKKLIFNIPFFYGCDNSDMSKFETQLGIDNRNVKMLCPHLKLGRKIHDYTQFFRVGQI